MRKVLLGLWVWSMLARAASVVAAAEAPPGGGVAVAAPAPSPTIVALPVRYGNADLPSHLVMGNQIFDTNVAGLRAYLDSIKTTSPQLFGQLNPDLEGLEARATGARVVLLTGLGLGVASGAYAFLGRKDCRTPSVTDPAFEADSAAWSACNDDNMTKLATFTLLGLGALVAGAAGWLALTPGRSEYFEFVNKHNRLNPEPLRFQIGYDPTRRLAAAGAGVTF